MGPKSAPEDGKLALLGQINKVIPGLGVGGVGEEEVFGGEKEKRLFLLKCW